MQKKVKYLSKKKKGLFNSGLVKLAAGALIIGCSVLIITTEKDCAEKKQELIAIEAKTEAYLAENVELERIINDEDMSAYMEKVAIEERGYAYPDERRFYDTSRD